MHVVKERDWRKSTHGKPIWYCKGLGIQFRCRLKNARSQKDVVKHQDKKRDVFTITKPHKRSEPQETEVDIKVLSRIILNITFLIEDPRPPNWDPKDPILVTGYIHQMKVHHVYIDNDSSTNVLYGHCFRQLPTSCKEGLKPPTCGLLKGFIVYSLWPLGSIHVPLTLGSHDGKDKITWTVEFSVVCFLA